MSKTGKIRRRKAIGPEVPTGQPVAKRDSIGETLKYCFHRCFFSPEKRKCSGFMNREVPDENRISKFISE